MHLLEDRLKIRNILPLNELQRFKVDVDVFVEHDLGGPKAYDLRVCCYNIEDVKLHILRCIVLIYTARYNAMNMFEVVTVNIEFAIEFDVVKVELGELIVDVRNTCYDVFFRRVESDLSGCVNNSSAAVSIKFWLDYERARAPFVKTLFLKRLCKHYT
jgi:hypothetical protein